MTTATQQELRAVRLVQLKAFFDAGGKATAAELAELLAVHHRTMNRDLASLERTKLCPLVVDEHHRWQRMEMAAVAS